MAHVSSGQQGSSGLAEGTWGVSEVSRGGWVAMLVLPGLVHVPGGRLAAGCCRWWVSTPQRLSFLSRLTRLLVMQRQGYKSPFTSCVYDLVWSPALQGALNLATHS